MVTKWPPKASHHIRVPRERKKERQSLSAESVPIFNKFPVKPHQATATCIPLANTWPPTETQKIRLCLVWVWNFSHFCCLFSGMILCVATFMEIFIVGIFGSSVCAESEQQSHKDAGIYLLRAWYQQQSRCTSRFFRLSICTSSSV